MDRDRVRWNEKYKDAPKDRFPAAAVRRFARLAPAGRALDLAAGLGANALCLARQGFHVEAVDISDEAISALKQLSHPRITPIQADLDNFPLPAARYQLICMVHFLDRSLFPKVKTALAKGGMLIVDTHLITDAHVAGPKDPAYRLRPNELLALCAGLDIVYYREGLRHNRQWGRLCLATLAGIKP